MRCLPGVPVLPTEYSDALSYQEQIGKLSDDIMKLPQWLEEKFFSEANISEIISKMYGIPLNVTTAGVDNTGELDCTNTVNELISAGNNCLFFPAGTYKIVGTINLNNNICVYGEGLSTRFLGVGSNDILKSKNFDVYAGKPNTSESLGTCNNIMLSNFAVCNGKTGIAVYGYNNYITHIYALANTNIGIHLESPGSVHSSATQPLPNSISNVYCGFNTICNFYYNGQSDSNIFGLNCYYGGPKDTQYANSTNVYFGPKASGIRVLNSHVWGLCSTGVSVSAGGATFSNVHIEGANILLKLSSGLFQGNNLLLYNPITTESIAIYLDASAGTMNISGIVRQCKYIVSNPFKINPYSGNISLLVRDCPDDFVWNDYVANNLTYDITVTTTSNETTHYYSTPVARNLNTTFTTFKQAVFKSAQDATISGYITIYDSNGVARRIAVVS